SLRHSSKNSAVGLPNSPRFSDAADAVPKETPPGRPSGTQEQEQQPEDDLNRLLDEEGKKTGLDLSGLEPEIRVAREAMQSVRTPEPPEPSRVKPAPGPSNSTDDFDYLDKLKEYHEASKTLTQRAFGARTDSQQLEANRLASNFDDAHDKIRDLENRMKA